MKSIKRIVAFLLCVFMLTSFVGCKPQPKLTISDKTLAMSLFDEKTITVDTDIAGDIVWTNSDDTVLKVTADDDSAALIAVGSGSSTVTATVGGKSVSCAVTVAATTDTLVLDVSTSKAIVATVGSTSQIEAAVTFKNAAFAKASIAYAVSSAEPAGCVTVSDTGLISAVATGTATVNVKASYLGHYSNEVAVTVSVVDLDLDLTEVKLVVGDERYTQEAEVVANYVIGATETEAEVSDFSVVDEDIATFEGGKIKALAVGSTIMTLVFNYNNEVSFSKQVSITVANAPEVVLAAQSVTVDMRDLRGDAEAVIYEDDAALAVNVTVDGVAVEAPAISYAVKAGSEDVISVKDGVVTGLAGGTGVVVASYTDDFGLVHTTEINVTVNANIYYGKHSKYAVDALVADIPAWTSLYIENVDLTEAETPLISVQYIPKDTYTGDWCSGTTANGADPSVMAPGAKMFFVTIIDAENAKNYITIALRQSYDNWYDPTHIVYMGARTSAWGDFSNAQPGAADFFSATGSMGGNGGYAAATQFSMYGRYLDNAHHCSVGAYCACDNDTDYLNNYEDYMLNLYVDGTKVFYKRSYKDANGAQATAWTELVDLGNVDGMPAWAGFGDSTKVNILIDSDMVNTGYSGDYSVAITKLGGQAVTAANVNDGVYFCRNFTDIKVGTLFPKGWQPAE